MYEHNALGYMSSLPKARSSRARCPATALIYIMYFIVCKWNLITHTIDEIVYFVDSVTKVYHFHKFDPRRILVQHVKHNHIRAFTMTNNTTALIVTLKKLAKRILCLV